MNVAPVAHADQTSGTTPTSGAGSLGDSTTMFISLLTAELKAQDPISPRDPNQMVQQIVSLSQLDQLIQIHNVLQPPAATDGSTKSAADSKSN
jgi:flagellar basal-body rod modification protein FlgD